MIGDFKVLVSVDHVIFEELVTFYVEVFGVTNKEVGSSEIGTDRWATKSSFATASACLTAAAKSMDGFMGAMWRVNQAKHEEDGTSFHAAAHGLLGGSETGAVVVIRQESPPNKALQTDTSSHAPCIRKGRDSVPCR